MPAVSREERRRLVWFLVVLALIVAFGAFTFSKWSVRLFGAGAILLMGLPGLLFFAWLYWGIGWVRKARPPVVQAALDVPVTGWRARMLAWALPVYVIGQVVIEAIESISKGSSGTEVFFRVLFAVPFAVVGGLIMHRVALYFRERVTMHRQSGSGES